MHDSVRVEFESIMRLAPGNRVQTRDGIRTF